MRAGRPRTPSPRRSIMGGMEVTPAQPHAEGPRGEEPRLRAAVALLAAGNVLLLALMVAGLFGALTGRGATGAAAGAAEQRGSSAVDTLALDLPLLAGGRVTAAELRGRVTVLNVWASWCGPCRVEAPALRRIAANADPARVVFVGVARNDDDAPARAFIAAYAIPYANALDDGSVTKRYRVAVLPTTLIFDRRGELFARIAGTVTEDRLLRLIDDALAAP
ncbi:MAG: TlpA family protein disulfide reductase [Dehalococcoidia bacterium]|nr:TlpA family protein disulfide reductase [Dehalococcoidia bacterium]